MKFKKVTGEDYTKRITIPDSEGDGCELHVETPEDGSAGLYFFIDGSGIRTTRKKALKLADAIINELDPI